MSIRIHRAMGWGMPWADFERLNTLKEADGDGTKYWLGHLLDYTFDHATPETLTLTKDEHKAQWKEPDMSILERHLTSTNFTLGTKDEPIFGRASDLFFTAHTPDETQHVGFIPALHFRKKWYRYSDDLDYAFEMNRDDSGNGELRDFTTYQKFGHYPWTNELMLTDGSHTPWDHFTLLERRDDWRPAVPAEIRWYLKKLGVMNDAGINELRPMISQWWS